MENEQEKLLISAIKEKLKLSFEERIESHEKARELLNDLREAGKEKNAKPEEAS